ncbi:MAG: FecR domain-containing protein [Parvibaculum sp.]|uniref:FecR domain-containing protein n=1 Tax=Parvibaculum sp. TaxID=2024848 RepID=UPI00271E5085|nr:FecR domain-containing protein [Parvibaculum sp.]MDO8840228.1 FecR domain-containing protein [Parvibaculum sp.]
MFRIHRKLSSGRILAAAALMFAASSAHAGGSSSWHVEMMSGEAYIQTGGAMPVSLTPNGTVAPGAVIETGETGRVVLSRGTESIMVSPNSSIAVSPDSDSGGMTRILQRVGTILLQVDKQDRQHFEVETPYLAAVVKGTKFTVSVDAEGAAVHVMEGAVETIDLDTGDVGMVRPGQTAHTLASKGSGLEVSGPGVEPVQRGKDAARAQDTPRVAPKVEDHARSAGKAMEIHAERRAAVDIAKSTNGLARGLDMNGNNGNAARTDDADSDPAVRATGNSVSQVASAGRSATAPGQSGSAPGASGTTPGQSGATPGLSGTTPGQSGSAPGLAGTTPGQSGSAPGLGGSTPGQSGTAPGLAGSTPGQPGSAPGLGGSTPGRSGTAPGLVGSTPGQSGSAPGQSGGSNGKSGGAGRPS